MTAEEVEAVLGADDPDPVAITGDERAGTFVLLGDHAGNRVPRSLGDLGLTDENRRRHIALDLGIAQLGEALSRRLGAPFVAQRYSRLVADCNRDPRSPDAIVAVSDGTPIAGNAGLDEQRRAVRIAAVHAPYHAAIAGLLDARAREGARTVLVALHSFTPVLAGEARPWTVGVLHDREPNAFAAHVLAALRGEPALVVGDNQPYAFDGTDYTIPHHAAARALEWVELEMRQDQLATPADVAQIADLLAGALVAADGGQAAPAAGASPNAHIRSRL